MYTAGEFSNSEETFLGGGHRPCRSTCHPTPLCLRSLVLAHTWTHGLRTPPGACSSPFFMLTRLNILILLILILVVFRRFLNLRERMPSGAYTTPASYDSWCLHASGVLMSKRFLVSARPGLLILHSPSFSWFLHASYV